MPQKKKQHYIPRMILRNFSDNGYIYLCDVTNKKILNNSVPYKNQCQEDYMYGSDLLLENGLGKIENEASVIINRIISNNEFTQTDGSMLKNLIITQWLRTKGAAIRAQLGTTKTMLEICDDCGLQVDASICVQEDNNLYKKIAADNVNFAINGELNTDGLELCLLVNRTDTELIISDDPVVIGNEFQPNYGLGVECAGVYFFMPISPFHILLLYDNKMYELQRSELSVTDIQYLNNKQLKKAYKNLYARDRNSLVSIMDRFDAYLASTKLPPDVGRRSFPAGNNILKLNREFVPYIDKCKFVFMRGNVNEWMVKGMF